MMTAKLVLILANHVGDREVLREAIALARDNTLAHSAPLNNGRMDRR